MSDPFSKSWQDPEPETYELTPTSPTYPTSLPHDLAVCMTPEEVEHVREKYALSEEELEYICNRQDFKREYSEWKGRLISEGNSFKLKLRAMAEEFLPTLHEMLHSDSTAPSVRMDAFKYITKCAELEPVPVKDTVSGVGSQQTRLVISWADGSGQVAVETKNGG